MGDQVEISRYDDPTNNTQGLKREALDVVELLKHHWHHHYDQNCCGGYSVKRKDLFAVMVGIESMKRISPYTEFVVPGYVLMQIPYFNRLFRVKFDPEVEVPKAYVERHATHFAAVKLLAKLRFLVRLEASLMAMGVEHFSFRPWMRGLHKQALSGRLLGGIENAIDFFLEILQQNMGRGFHSFVGFVMKLDICTTAQDVKLEPAKQYKSGGSRTAKMIAAIAESTQLLEDLFICVLAQEGAHANQVFILLRKRNLWTDLKCMINILICKPFASTGG